jgi:pyruvate,water dikinase
MYIIQARPETVHSSKKKNIYQEYKLLGKGKVLVQGTAIGRKIGAGAVHVIRNVKDIGKFKKGEVLVTVMTDPDWEPIMKIASAIVTDIGSKTSHAAIVSRELGIPCIVGTLNGTKNLKSSKNVTVDCTAESGQVLDGLIKFKEEQHEVGKIPKTRTLLMVNLGEPESAMDVSQLPVDGVGLAREEFIIATNIGEHPLAMIKQKREHIYIDKLAEGIAKIGAAFYPRPVIVRLSDFKTNEYGTLKGGKGYEPPEENPMIGWRGASRYVDKQFEPAFRLECKAFKKVRDVMGVTNVKIMVPFCPYVCSASKQCPSMSTLPTTRLR